MEREFLGCYSRLSCIRVKNSSMSVGTDSFMSPPSAMYKTFLARDTTKHISQTERSHLVEVIARAVLNPSEGSIHPKGASAQ
jgi:hypothetical protein